MSKGFVPGLRHAERILCDCFRDVSQRNVLDVLYVEKRLR